MQHKQEFRIGYNQSTSRQRPDNLECLKQPGILMVGSKENMLIQSTSKYKKFRIIKLSHSLKQRQTSPPDILMLQGKKHDYTMFNNDKIKNSPLNKGQLKNAINALFFPQDQDSIVGDTKRQNTQQNTSTQQTEIGLNSFLQRQKDATPQVIDELDLLPAETGLANIEDSIISGKNTSFLDVEMYSKQVFPDGLSCFKHSERNKVIRLNSIPEPVHVSLENVQKDEQDKDTTPKNLKSNPTQDNFEPNHEFDNPLFLVQIQSHQKQDTSPAEGLSILRFLEEPDFVPPKVNDIHFNLSINDCEPTVFRSEKKVIGPKKNYQRRNINTGMTLNNTTFLLQAGPAKFQSRKPKTEKYVVSQQLRQHESFPESLKLKHGELKRRSTTPIASNLTQSKIQSADLQNLIDYKPLPSNYPPEIRVQIQSQNVARRKASSQMRVGQSVQPKPLQTEETNQKLDRSRMNLVSGPLTVDQGQEQFNTLAPTDVEDNWQNVKIEHPLIESLLPQRSQTPTQQTIGLRIPLSNLTTEKVRRSMANRAIQQVMTPSNPSDAVIFKNHDLLSPFNQNLSHSIYRKSDLSTGGVQACMLEELKLLQLKQARIESINWALEQQLQEQISRNLQVSRTQQFPQIRIVDKVPDFHLHQKESQISKYLAYKERKLKRHRINQQLKATDYVQNLEAWINSQ